jgi:hypothetical protein
MRSEKLNGIGGKSEREFIVSIRHWEYLDSPISMNTLSLSDRNVAIIIEKGL